MKKVQDEFLSLKNIATAISKQFGDKCEVVIHDFSEGYENSIKLIENGHVTGRKEGSSITNMGLENLVSSDNDDLKKEGGIHNYTTTTKDGKTLRSSTALIQDDQGQVIGSLCINFDITDFIHAGNVIKQFTDIREDKIKNEVFVNDVNELLDSSLKESLDYVGKPVSMMTKDDKIKAIQYLDQKGIFSITKSGNKVCDLFGISKYTLYSYLDVIRS